MCREKKKFDSRVGSFFSQLLVSGFFLIFFYLFIFYFFVFRFLFLFIFVFVLFVCFFPSVVFSCYVSRRYLQQLEARLTFLSSAEFGGIIILVFHSLIYLCCLKYQMWVVSITVLNITLLFNLQLKHNSPQNNSSSPSRQSLTPSQIWDCGKQFELPWQRYFPGHM